MMGGYQRMCGLVLKKTSKTFNIDFEVIYSLIKFDSQVLAFILNSCP